MSHSKLPRDIDLPPGGENEEFLVVYQQQVASQAGKSRNMTRKWNNINSGRDTVQSAKRLSLFDICVIHTARRVAGQRVQPLTVKALETNSRSATKRRCEAFNILRTWVKNPNALSVKGAQFLLQAENLRSTQHLGLEKIAKDVLAKFETEKRVADVIFNAAAANDEADVDDDDPMVPIGLPEERSPTPASAPEDPPQQSYGIHHSMIDFHIPFSQVNQSPSFVAIT
jgi:hypothetical protein